MRRISFVVGVLAAWALLAAGAHGAILVYNCGAAYENLCGANADGSGQRQVTTDGQSGSSSRYGSPSLSRDGHKLAFNFASDTHVLDLVTGAKVTITAPIQPLVTRLRPDGALVAVGDQTGTSTELCTYNSDGSGPNQGRECRAGSLSGFDWLPGSRLIATESGDTANNFHRKLCLIFAPESGTTGCERDMVVDPNHNLEDPAVSPNGALVAVTQADTGMIAVYDLGTGAFVRQLSSGPQDDGPAWAPDGSAVYFDRGASGAEDIYSVPAGGGAETLRISHGRSPTLGESAAQGGGGGAVARVTKLGLSPNVFRAASSGPSAIPAATTGTIVTTDVSAATALTFTVEKSGAGRRVRGKCVKPSRANRRKPRCTRYVKVRGSFTANATPGGGRFRFTGRMGGRKLSPGSYRLVATPRGGKPKRASFRIKR